jgi:molybdopterin/thiamine biosynthesis adenylyltransferase
MNNRNFFGESLTRQLDLIPMTALDKSITIIGAGAIGGWTTLSLAKMGYLNLTVFDFDTVDIVNLNSQLYRHRDIKKPKVDALKEIVNDFTGYDITSVNDKFTGGSIASDIVISAVDSMVVRKQIWDSVKGNPFVKTFIDPRMGSETALLYVINPNDAKDIATYEKTLYTDENAVSEPCTRKATQYCALSLSGLVCAQVKSVTTNNDYSRITQWNIPSGSFMAWSKSGKELQK